MGNASESRTEYEERGMASIRGKFGKGSRYQLRKRNVAFFEIWMRQVLNSRDVNGHICIQREFSDFRVDDS